MMEAAYLWIALTLTVLYVVQTTIKYGILPSISHSYLIRKKGWLFQLWCWSMSILLFLGLYQIADLVFFASFGFAVVGAAPKINEGWQKPAHFIGALFTILGGCAVVMQLHLVIGIIVTSIIAGFSLYAYRSKLKNKIFWIEVLALGSIFLTLLIKFKDYGKEHVQEKQ